MSDNTKTVFVSVAAIIMTSVLILGMKLIDHRDTTLANQANCVAAVAKAEGYTGNVHGPEAYDIFIGSCR